MSQRIKGIVLRRWEDVERTRYIEVIVRRLGFEVATFELDKRKRQYRKPKFERMSWAPGPMSLKELRSWARYPGYHYKTALAMVLESGLTSSVVEHPPRKRERAGSTPASGSFDLMQFSVDFLTVSGIRLSNA